MEFDELIPLNADGSEQVDQISISDDQDTEQLIQVSPSGTKRNLSTPLAILERVALHTDALILTSKA